MTELLSINQAASIGQRKLRSPKWANPLDHIVIDIFDGSVGPWVHLYSPINEAIHGKRKDDILITGFDVGAVEYERYEGPAHDSDEYTQAIDRANRLWLGETVDD